jgi:hypothetical protein
MSEINSIFINKALIFVFIAFSLLLEHVYLPVAQRHNQKHDVTVIFTVKITKCEDINFIQRMNQVFHS